MKLLYTIHTLNIFQPNMQKKISPLQKMSSITLLIFYPSSQRILFRVICLALPGMAPATEKTVPCGEGSLFCFTKAAHALYYPSLGVVGTAGFVPAGYTAIPGRYGAIGMNVTIPIFNGGLFKARQSEAELKAQAATENISGLQNRVMRDVRVAYLNAIAAYDRVALTDQLLKQAQLSLDLADTRYNLGLGSIVELSQAQLNLTSAQIASASARYDYQAQRVVVDYQVGSLR